MSRLMNWPQLRDEYGTYHTTPGNRACHIVGIPLIMLAVVRWSMIGPVPLAAVFIPLYLAWHRGLGLAMAAVIAAMAAAASRMPAWGAPAAFVLGWAFQLYGHSVYEKRSPAFTDNLVHLLVGPMWVLRELLR